MINKIVKQGNSKVLILLLLAIPVPVNQLSLFKGQIIRTKKAGV